MTTVYEMAAIRTFLLADPDVAALVGQRVYADEVPDGVLVGEQPPKTVLINSAGGSFVSRANRSFMPVESTLKDVRCYGESLYESRRVWDAVNDALRNMRRHLEGNVLLYSASKIGGPTTLREPQVEWPVTFGSFDVLAAEEG